jgi:hypothetical protein
MQLHIPFLFTSLSFQYKQRRDDPIGRTGNRTSWDENHHYLLP